jgi:hypothetical protein
MPSIRTVIAVIRICRRLHPEPWYYRRDPIQDGIEFTNLPPVLQYLESEKLVEKVDDPISGEKGVCLSERGLRVADDPAAMERLAEGVAMDPQRGRPRLIPCGTAAEQYRPLDDLGDRCRRTWSTFSWGRGLLNKPRSYNPTLPDSPGRATDARYLFEIIQHSR